MAQLSLTYPTVTDGVTVVDAVIHNTNWSECVAAVNNVDHTQIGAAGLYASQLLPTTAAEATFGATATGVGYKFLANDATAVPLTVSGVAGQSADIFDVTLTSGGAIAFKIEASGAAGFNSTITAGGYIATTSGGLAVAGLTNPSSATPLSFGTSSATAMDIAAYSASAALSILNDVGLAYMPVTGGAYTNGASDARLKTNIKTIPHNLDNLLKLLPRSFDWIATGESEIGFISQEVFEAMPEATVTNTMRDGGTIMGLKYNALTALTVSAIIDMAARLKAAGVAGF